MMYNERTDPGAKPEINFAKDEAEPAKDRRSAAARRNPRIVVGTLDFFELLMEQDEQ